LQRADAALARARAEAASAAEELARERQVRRAAEHAAATSAAEVEALRARLAEAEAERQEMRPRAERPTVLSPLSQSPPSSVVPSRKPERPRRRPSPLPPAVLDDSPEAADHLVRLPGVLVLVDGYNASLAYRPDLPIPELRRRLVDALDELVARTGADVHVVFDGAEQVGEGPTTRTGGRRGAARVQFSAPDVEADDVILAIVDEVPLSRPVVVASDDRRVQDGARDRGANAISSGQLLAALRRER
jgi:predicted RNA-binding protein with PIN domain